MKAKKDLIGNIIKIGINENIFGFGRIVEGGFIEFYDLKLSNDQIEGINEKLIGSKVIFTLSVHKSWEKNKNWEVVGKNLNNVSSIPSQFMQSIGNQNDIKIIDSTGNSRPATKDEVKGIERLAVWEDNHVEDRLRDYFDGKQNIWVEHLKPK